MHDPSSLTHKFSGPRGQLEGRYVTQHQRTLSLSGATIRQRKKGLKPQWGGKKNDPFAVQFNQDWWETLLFIFLFTATFFISIPTSQAQSEDRFRPWRMNSPKVKTFPIWNHNFLSCQYKAVNPLCIRSSQRAQKSLLRSRVTNTSYCHRTESVRDKDHHCPLHCVSQLLSSVTN